MGGEGGSTCLHLFCFVTHRNTTHGFLNVGSGNHTQFFMLILLSELSLQPSIDFFLCKAILDNTWHMLEMSPIYIYLLICCPEKWTFMAVPQMPSYHPCWVPPTATPSVLHGLQVKRECSALPSSSAIRNVSPPRATASFPTYWHFGLYTSLSWPLSPFTFDVLISTLSRGLVNTLWFRKPHQRAVSREQTCIH
jgi:hypothetical protein